LQQPLTSWIVAIDAGLILLASQWIRKYRPTVLSVYVLHNLSQPQDNIICKLNSIQLLHFKYNWMLLLF